MIFEILIFLSSIPAGLLIAWLARDELIDGRIYFKWLIFASFLLGIAFLFLIEYASSLTSLWITIISSVSLWKSYDKKWTKRRI